MAEIDRLSIRFTADAENAVENIADFSAAVKKLSTVLKGLEKSENFDRIAQGAKNLTKVLDSISKSINRINPKRLKDLAAVMKTVNKAAESFEKSGLQTVSDALTGNIPKSAAEGAVAAKIKAGGYDKPYEKEEEKKGFWARILDSFKGGFDRGKPSYIQQLAINANEAAEVIRRFNASPLSVDDSQLAAAIDLLKESEEQIKKLEDKRIRAQFDPQTISDLQKLQDKLNEAEGVIKKWRAAPFTVNDEDIKQAWQDADGTKKAIDAIKKDTLSVKINPETLEQIQRLQYDLSEAKKVKNAFLKDASSVSDDEYKAALKTIHECETALKRIAKETVEVKIDYDTKSARQNLERELKDAQAVVKQRLKEPASVSDDDFYSAQDKVAELTAKLKELDKARQDAKIVPVDPETLEDIQKFQYRINEAKKTIDAFKKDPASVSSDSLVEAIKALEEYTAKLDEAKRLRLEDPVDPAALEEIQRLQYGINETRKVISAFKKDPTSVSQDSLIEAMKSLQEYTKLLDTAKRSRLEDPVDPSALEEIQRLQYGINEAKKTIDAFKKDPTSVSADSLVGAIKNLQEYTKKLDEAKRIRVEDPVDPKALSGLNRLKYEIDEARKKLKAFESDKTYQGNEKEYQSTFWRLQDLQKAWDMQIGKTPIIDPSTLDSVQRLYYDLEQAEKKVSDFKENCASISGADFQAAVERVRELRKEWDKLTSDNSNPMQEAANALRGLASAPEPVKGLSMFMDNLSRSTLATSGAFAGLSTTISGISQAIPYINMAVIAVQGLVFVYNKLTGIGEKVLKSMLSTFQGIARGAGTVASSIGNLVDKIKGGFSSAISAVRNLHKGFSSFVADVKGKFKSVVASISKLSETELSISGLFDRLNDSISKKINTLGARINKALRTFVYIGFRKLITQVYEQFSDSLTSLQAYSDRIGSAFSPSVQLAAADFKYLSDSILAAFEPVVNAVVPILDLITEKIVTLINVINQLFSALSGGTTWTKATKQVKEYDAGVSSAGKAAKAARSFLLGIDELNVFDNSDSSGGGGAGGAGGIDTSQWETQEIEDWVKDLKELLEGDDWSELGTMIGEKLGKALLSIPWEKVKASAAKAAKRFSSLINGFFAAEVDGMSLGTIVGKTIGEAINSALVFLEELDIDWKQIADFFADAIVAALDTIEWDRYERVMKKLADDLVSFFNELIARKDLWSTVGESIGKMINGVLAFAHEFVSKLNWDGLGEDLSILIKNALLKIDWVLAGETFGLAVNGFFTAVKAFFADFPSTEVASAITAGVNKAIETFDPVLAGEAIKGALNSAIAFVKTAVEEFNWEETGAKFGTLVNEIFTGVSWEDLGDLLGKAINGVLDFIISAIDKIDIDGISASLVAGLNTAITKVDSDKLKDAGSKITDAFFTVIGDALDGVKWDELGTKLGSLANGLLDKIHEKVSEFDFAKLGANIGTALKNAANAVNWEHLGETVSLLFNGAFDFIKAFLKEFDGKDFGDKVKSAVKTALENIKWEDIKETCNAVGKNIADFLNEFIQDEAFWKTVGDALVGAVNSIGGFIAGLTSTDFKALEDGIKSVISNAVENIEWSDLSSAINSLITGLCTLVADIINSPEYEQLKEQVKELIRNLPWGDIADLALTLFKEQFSLKFNILGTAGAEFVAAIASGAVSALNLGQAIISALTWQNGLAPMNWALQKAFQGVGVNFGTWVKDGGLKFLDGSNTIPASSWANGVSPSSTALSQEFSKLGSNAAEGFEKGVSENLSTNASDEGSVPNLFQGLVTGLCFLLGIHSPSTVMKGIGENFVEGWDNGVSGFSTSSENLTTQFSNLVSTIGVDVTTFVSGVLSDFSALSSDGSASWSTLSGNVEKAVSGIHTAVSTKFGLVKTVVKTDQGEIDTKEKTSWEALTKLISETWDGFHGVVSNKSSEIVTSVTESLATISDENTASWGSISDTVGQETTSIHDSVSKAFKDSETDTLSSVSSIKTTVEDGFSSSANSVSESVESMRSAVSAKMNSAKTAVQDAIDAIKKKFDFEWKFPELKLPHISASGEFSLNPLSVPSFSIEWKRNGGFIGSGSQGSFISSADLFGMNENGEAEMLGHIGNRQAVVNNDQIVQAVANGVASAIAGSLGDILVSIAESSARTADKDFSVRIDSREIARSASEGRSLLGRTILS